MLIIIISRYVYYGVLATSLKITAVKKHVVICFRLKVKSERDILN